MEKILYYIERRSYLEFEILCLALNILYKRIRILRLSLLIAWDDYYLSILHRLPEWYFVMLEWLHCALRTSYGREILKERAIKI